MEEERHSLKRHSMGSRRSHSSDRSLQGLMEDLNGRVPRYNDIVYVMSIESDTSKRSRTSDLLERKGNSIRYSNEGKQMEIESHDLSRGSHGILGKYQPRQLQMYQEEVMAHECDCYRDCIGEECGCSKTLLIEPCIEGKCCSGCIELKNRRIEIAAEASMVKFQPRPSAPVVVSKTGCSCKKTRCLKYYCQCFAKKGFCSQNCNCQQCLNMFESQARNNAMVQSSNTKQQQRGCNCRKTKCEKKYCACYGAGMKCTKLCQCQNCANMNEQLKVIRNFHVPSEQPFYPPMVPVTPVDKLPVNIQFTDFELPNFANLRISDK